MRTQRVHKLHKDKNEEAIKEILPFKKAKEDLEVCISMQ